MCDIELGGKYQYFDYFANEVVCSEIVAFRFENKKVVAVKFSNGMTAPVIKDAISGFTKVDTELERLEEEVNKAASRIETAKTIYHETIDEHNLAFMKLWE